MTIKCFLIEATGEYTPWVEGETGRSRQELYRRIDNGEMKTIDEHGIGAIWEATWFNKYPEYCGTDGRSFVCMTPGGEWMIDSRASNCTMPDDKVHKCWCRHGDAPNFTVNKIGNTCAAGAGSIAIGSYHGFLQNGHLT